MQLADATKKSEDNFKVLLNYKGKHDFTQEACVYGGEDRFVYDIQFGNADYYVIAPKDVKREAIFDVYEKFLDNLTKVVSKENNPYTAVLLYNETKLEPIITVDVSRVYKTQEILLIFGNFGETAVFGYDNVNLAERLQRAFDEKKDLSEVRNGSEAAVKAIFGDPDLAEIMPPDKMELKDAGQA